MEDKNLVQVFIELHSSLSKDLVELKDLENALLELIEEKLSGKNI